MVRSPRYDGLAAWYDDEIRTGPAAAITALAVDTACTLLGRGEGRCLDLGCGTGVALAALTVLGFEVVGVDVSADQLQVAEERAGDRAEVVRADAVELPFADDSFDAVVSVLTHTDFDDLETAFAEAMRVLRPGGRLVYVGTHPCFVTPFTDRSSSPIQLHPGYRSVGWHAAGPGFGIGIRPRVGANHATLEGLASAVLDAGLRLDRLVEPGEDDYPILLGLAGSKPDG